MRAADHDKGGGRVITALLMAARHALKLCEEEDRRQTSPDSARLIWQARIFMQAVELYAEKLRSAP